MKTTLIVMAAGMGSRFGGPKQITPVGPSGEKIIDYSVFDARRAGFDEVVFVISPAIEKDFKEAVGQKIETEMPTKYVLQQTPPTRKKPWGTGHAVLSCKEVVHHPFMVINADDFYGRESFRLLHDYLTEAKETDRLYAAMAGYRLGHTVTENGSVSRGVCEVDGNGRLLSITERTKIVSDNGELYDIGEGVKVPLTADTIVSLNCWAFDARFMRELEVQFSEFVRDPSIDPQKTEFYLPSAVDRLITENRADVHVLPTSEKWYGMTYAQDRQTVSDAIGEMVKKGIYPEKLWR